MISDEYTEIITSGINKYCKISTYPEELIINRE